MELLAGLLIAALIFWFFKKSGSDQPPDGAFPMKAVGVSYKNTDGTSRQNITSKLQCGDEIQLVAEPDNPYDAKAVAVMSISGQVGYLPAEKCSDIFNALIKGIDVDAGVLDILINKTKGSTRGVVLWVKKNP